MLLLGGKDSQRGSDGRDRGNMIFQRDVLTVNGESGSMKICQATEYFVYDKRFSAGISKTSLERRRSTFEKTLLFVGEERSKVRGVMEGGEKEPIVNHHRH